MKLNSRELATVLAALRLWQRHKQVGGIYSELWTIATNGNRLEALEPEEVDDLCERLNCGGDGDASDYDSPVKIVHTETGVEVAKFTDTRAAQKWLDNYQVSPAYKHRCYRIVPA